MAAKKEPLRNETREEKLARAREAGALLWANEPRAISVSYNDQSDSIVVVLNNGSTISFPPHLGQGLAGASTEDLSDVEITPSGQGLHWEKLDVDLSIPGILAGIFGTKAWMAEIGRKGGQITSESKSKAARENGKKGGRPPMRSAASM